MQAYKHFSLSLVVLEYLNGILTLLNDFGELAF